MAHIDVKFFVQCPNSVSLARAIFGDNAQGRLTVAHYSCTHVWRCSGQCRCRTVLLYPWVALRKAVSLSYTTALSKSGAAHDSVTVAHYSCMHGWRCSWQCHCRTLLLYPWVALLKAVSLSYTTAFSTGGAAHDSVAVAHYNCIHGWRYSQQCHCRTLQLYPRVALLTAVSLSHTT